MELGLPNWSLTHFFGGVGNRRVMAVEVGVGEGWLEKRKNGGRSIGG